MSEPRFLRHTRGLTLAEIATLTGAAPPASLKRAQRVVDAASLDSATPEAVTFLDSKSNSKAVGKTHAAACLTTAALARYLPPDVTALIVQDPFGAFVTVTRELFAHALRPSSLAEAGDTAGAHVHPAARLEIGVTVEPGAVIGARAEIGSGSVIGAAAVIGTEVRIGRDCSIGAGTVITNGLIGDRVIIHPGCKLGQDGFGFLRGENGYLKVPQVGRVIVQDDVEIGAGTTIDRGSVRDTVIGEGSKIDNLVQVGHNATIGRHCILAGRAGVGGSSTLEDFAVLGGGVGVSDHVTIGEGAQLAGASNVHSDVPPGGRWAGTPAKPVRLWLREVAAVARLARANRSAATTMDKRDNGHG